MQAVDTEDHAGRYPFKQELIAPLGRSVAEMWELLWRVHAHEIRFTGPDTANGRVHVFNRNGIHWEGAAEIVDVGAVYEDTYARDGDRWSFVSRVEHTTYMTGGADRQGRGTSVR